MKKPKSLPGIQVIKGQGYDLYEILHFIKKKEKIDPWDFFDSGNHFNSWCDQKGYGKVDPEGKKRNSSQLWFKEYMSSPDGEVKCPPYKDFFTWLFNEFSPEEFDNEQPFEFDVESYLSNKELEPYMKTILEKIQKHFGSSFTCFLSEN